VISELRSVLLADLVAGYAVTGTGSVPRVVVSEGWLPRINPPAVVVEPGEPYVIVGQVFGAYEVRMELTILVARDLADLDLMIETAISNTADWGMQGVSMPRTFTYAGQDMLRCTVFISKQDKIS
jgi:hypothetical protein